ncbi:MAG TPA: ABC transporter permease [Verrucomicrobiae bacterium]|nr:ABC transporter permease [Verrucomicrobiae bacterium]
MNILSYKKRIEENLTGLGQICLLARDATASLLTWKFTCREMLYQLYFIGVKSQAVVLITGAFTGMVFCAQTYFKFHEVKMDTATLAVVSVAMCSELGPVLTALMVTGRVGAAMTAEIGTMRVTEQIDALRTLATHPVDYLVVPRLVAAITAMPILMIEAAVLGIGASYLLGVFELGIDPTYSWYNMIHFTHVADLTSGLIKAFIFGGIVAMIGCYKGLTCGLGAEGVGRATTQAVVYASITILVSDFFLSLTLNRILGLS